MAFILFYYTLQYGKLRFKYGILGQISDIQVSSPDHGSQIRFFQPCCNLKEGGFPRTVDSNQADFIPLINRK